MNRLFFATFAVLFASTVFGQSIRVDTSQAFTSAFIEILFRALVAYGFFKVITHGLNKGLLTNPVNNGRWVGAILVAVQIITYTRKYKQSDSDFYYSIALGCVGFFLVGFAAGFIWRTIKPLNDESQTSSSPLNQTTFTDSRDYQPSFKAENKDPISNGVHTSSHTFPSKFLDSDSNSQKDSGNENGYLICPKCAQKVIKEKSLNINCTNCGFKGLGIDLPCKFNT